MTGWGKRRNEWQFGLGIQHEILPRMSVEVTYNRRKYGNLTDTDTVSQGCDYYQTPVTNAGGIGQSRRVRGRRQADSARMFVTGRADLLCRDATPLV